MSHCLITADRVQQEAQITNDMFRSLSFRAKDIVVAVARSCHGMQMIAAQLESDLRQLTRFFAHEILCMWFFIELYLSSTMESILAYASERLTRRTYQKLLSKSEDAERSKI